MQQPKPRSDDEIDQILAADLSTAHNETLRQAVLVQTTRSLRRRRGLRRLRFALALSFCYTAGLLTMQVWKSSSTVPLPTAGPAFAKIETHNEKQPVGAPPVLEEPAQVPLEMDQSVPAVVLERIGASPNTENRAVYYRLAGDRYLELDGDLASAVRCYKQSLDAASETELAISTSDNWLFMAMKKARQGEKTHAKSDS
jgi:hypothetical protein